MDSIDNFRERFEALEQQTEQLKHQTQALEAHTRTVERRLRWWRGIACGVGLLGLVSLPLQSGTAADTHPGAMADRMATLENKLRAMAFDDAANEVVITGANLRIVNGLGSTSCTDAQGNPIPNCPNGLGNLIVGYNEPRQGDPTCPPTDRNFSACTDTRTGSHSVVVGSELNFSMFGGLVVGFRNEISGPFASVSGGSENRASGPSASVSGGEDNTARGENASVSGGEANFADADESSVSGGVGNRASGGESSVSGGVNNLASGFRSSVSGGSNRSAPAQFNWAAGALFSDN